MARTFEGTRRAAPNGGLLTNLASARQRRRFSLWVILGVLSVFGTGSALLLRGGQSILQLGIGVTAIVGLLLLRAGMERLSALAAVTACIVVPYFGLASDAVETSAILEIVWLVTAILVAGLVFEARWLVPVVGLHLSITAGLTLANPEISPARTWEVVTLLVLVASITSLTSASGERLDRRLADGMREMREREGELRLMEGIGGLLVELQGAEAIPPLCESIRNHFDLALVSVYILEPESGFLRSLGHAGYEFLGGHEGFRLSDRSQVVKCVREGVAQYLPDHPESSSDYVGGSPEVRSEYVLPLKVEGRVIGALNCEDRSPEAFPPERRALLGRVAHLCALALERAELVSRLEKQVVRRTEKLKQEIAERKQIEEDLIRANRELALAQEEVLQAGKLAALGEMGAGMAHELNQPLAAIQALAEAVRESRNEQVEDHVHDLDLICDQVRRMARIVDNVRLFSRQAPIRNERVAALLPLDDALTLLTNRFRLAGVELLPEIECGAVAIQGDSVQLQHVFMNLLANALHAVEELPGDVPRKVWLRVRAEGPCVVYEVQDNGPGVPRGLESRIFDPFFTTKAPGAGTGLGLSLSYGVVHKHGGELRHETPDEGGARFRVSIPLAADAAGDEAEEPVGDGSAPAARGRVLVVDDEQVVRFAFSRLLGSWGWEVIAARSGEEATELLENRPIDLAIVDLRMPRCHGVELCATIRERWPATRIVACSGHVEEDERSRLKGLGVDEILGKPVSGDELRTAIDRAMA